MSRERFIYGASGHGRVVLDICQQSVCTIHGFIDDNKSLKRCSGYEVKHLISPTDLIVLGVGRNQVRKKIFEKFEQQIFDAITHPSAIVSLTSKIGKGTVLMARAVVNPNALIGDACIINTAAIIEHDCVVMNFSHISPGAILCGGVQVGSNSHVGAGAVVLPGLEIGDNCTLGAGAVVTRNVPNGKVVAGNPAKPL